MTVVPSFSALQRGPVLVNWPSDSDAFTNCPLTDPLAKNGPVAVPFICAVKTKSCAAFVLLRMRILLFMNPALVDGSQPHTLFAQVTAAEELADIQPPEFIHAVGENSVVMFDHDPVPADEVTEYVQPLEVNPACAAAVSNNAVLEKITARCLMFTFMFNPFPSK